jgi:hypothetical protein
MFCSLSVKWENWFSKLSPKKQVAYLKKYPGSKYGTNEVRKKAGLKPVKIKKVDGKSTPKNKNNTKQNTKTLDKVTENDSKTDVVDPDSWFYRMSEARQVAYLKKHPTSMYGTNATRKKAGLKAVPKEVLEEENEDDTTDSADIDSNEGNPHDANDEGSEDTNEEPHPLEVQKEANQKVVSGMPSFMSRATRRVKAITKLTVKRYKNELGNTGKFFKSLLTGRKPTEDQKNSAKRVIGGIFGALLIVGAGAAIVSGANPMIARILADEYIAHKEWMSDVNKDWGSSEDRGDWGAESSAELSGRFNSELSNLIKDMADFAKDFDQDKLMELLDNA